MTTISSNVILPQFQTIKLLDIYSFYYVCAINLAHMLGMGGPRARRPWALARALLADTREEVVRP
jgi:hypothetical protein